MVVHIGRRGPDHLDFAGVDPTLLHLRFPDLGIQCAGFVGAALNEGNGGVMASAETRSTLELIGCDAGLREEMLRHQSPGGGALRAEGEAFSAQCLQLVLTLQAAQAAGAVGNENAGELGINVPLGQHA